MRKLTIIIIAYFAAILPLHGQESVNRILLPSVKDSARAVIGYDFRDEDRARSPQNGHGISEGYLDASSIKRLSDKDAFEGRITYLNGKRKGIKWNSGSDYDLLYPYVLADSLSGDLSRESYIFHGSYSHKTGRFFLGGKAEYRALHEFRQVDPRPRAISSDFKISLSGGCQVGNHLLDLTAGYRRYHQSLAVDFANIRGANTTEFHMTGLGSHFTRFSGTTAFTNTRYRGQGMSLALDYLPFMDAGISAGAAYSLFNSVRHLVNQNEAPITELTTHKLTAYAFYKHDLERGFWAAGANGGAEFRRGRENIVSNLITGNFETLLEMEMYSKDEFTAEIWGELSIGDFRARPSFEFTESDASYRYPGRKMNITILSADIPASFGFRIGETPLRISAGAGVDYSPANIFSIPVEYTMPLLLEDMRDQFDVLTDTRIRLLGSVLASRDIGKGMELTFEAKFSRWIYAGGYGANLLGTALGIRF